MVELGCVEQFVGFGGEKLARAKLAAQVFRGVSAEVAERHVNGAGGAHDGSIVRLVVHRDFPARYVSVTARLWGVSSGLLGGPKPASVSFKRLEHLSFHEIFPGGAGHLFGHRAGNGVADIRVRILLARWVCRFFGDHIQHRLSTRLGAFGTERQVAWRDTSVEKVRWRARCVGQQLPSVTGFQSS